MKAEEVWPYAALAAAAGLLLLPLAALLRPSILAAERRFLTPDATLLKQMRADLWAILHALEEMDFDRLRDPGFGGRIFGRLRELAQQVAVAYPKLPGLIAELEELCRRGRDFRDALKAAVQLNRVIDYILTGE